MKNCSTRCEKETLCIQLHQRSALPIWSAMDNYVVPLKSDSQNLKPIPRWKRSALELTGKFDPKYRHEISGLLMQSYSEIWRFPHSYHVDSVPCPTHGDRIANEAHMLPFRKQGISALDFDNKGIYLVSVTKSGCLTVHDFESLYLQSNKSSSGTFEEDETKLLLHLSLHQQLDFVRWNPANQDEVVCTSLKSNEVLIFDVGYVSSKPVAVLRARHVNNYGCDMHKGLSDIAFTSLDNSRLLACDTYGVINMWDRRMGTLPCLQLTNNSRSSLNRIQLNAENQIIFGAGKRGIIYTWDLRGGRMSAAFQSHNEVCHPPLMSLKLASMLEKIGSLKEQSNIIPKEIHSIDLNPTIPFQLAFHLDDGWSGILDIHNLQVTHVHCPPPAWLGDSDDSNLLADSFCLRKPSWISTNSHYVVGSSSNDGIYLLDFYPDPSSPSHVDYHDNLHGSSGVENQHRKNRFVSLSEGVSASAAHPFNGTIIAGTKNSSLLMVSQKQHSC